MTPFFGIKGCVFFENGSVPDFFQDLGKNLVHYNLHWKALQPAFNSTANVQKWEPSGTSTGQMPCFQKNA